MTDGKSDEILETTFHILLASTSVSVNYICVRMFVHSCTYAYKFLVGRAHTGTFALLLVM